MAEGNPSPTITWTRDKTDEVVGSGSTLVFCSAQIYDGGWYICNSKNSVGPSDRASIYLEVRGTDDNQLSVTKMSGKIKNTTKIRNVQLNLYKCPLVCNFFSSI